MEKIGIFDGICQGEIDEMLRCFSVTMRAYKAGSEILCYADSLRNVCVVLSGSVEIRCMDVEGNVSLLETLENSAVFGELFSLPMNSIVYTAVAKTDCEIMFIGYDCVIRRCERACLHHNQLINNLFQLSAQKAQQMSKHISILSQRTLRQKLMLYLEYLSAEVGAHTFTLPISLSRLAEYLCVDRSAMMRELQKMRNDALICSVGRKFTVIKPF